jgi:hypothetical protein
MKVILSRKGFDSSNGGCPSPILPDGTLLSLPIPSQDRDAYEALSFRGLNYGTLLEQLRPGQAFSRCHLDPDLRPDLRISGTEGWRPAFGQTDAAQGLLANAGVERGDLFLFFGWFRQTEQGPEGYRFVRRSEDFFRGADLHVIYGYLQIGEILTEPEEIAKYRWHPHASDGFLRNKANALYLPAERLSWNPEKKGYGVLDFRADRVLTMENSPRGTWTPKPFLMPEHVYGNRKNSAKGEGLYYAGIWQELVLEESEGLLPWARSMIDGPA